MKKYKGKGVYEAVAVGKAMLLGRRGKNILRMVIEDTAAELLRLDEAKKKAVGELSRIFEKAAEDIGGAEAQIFEIHMMLLEDDDFIGAVRNVITSQSVNAEYAVSVAGGSFERKFAAMDNEYMRERAADIRDITDRLIACLSLDTKLDVNSDEKLIICADDLTPSDTVTLDKTRVQAFVTAQGSANSHTSILARSMNIPAVVGAGSEFLKDVKNGCKMIVDGRTGDIIISPEPEIEREYIDEQLKERLAEDRLHELLGKPNVTKDGREIAILANIGGIDDITPALQNDAGGIGLFRSEFLYLGGSGAPTEEQQFSAYKQALQRMEGKKVIIRTLDIGADKQTDHIKIDKEENPALGMRAVRLCLTRPKLFRTQLRALYRASVYGRLGIMFPMITSISEVERCLEMCESVKKELQSEGTAFSDHVETGIMIETPAAALISDKLAPLVDFFSIGTNDLTQYTLACDRQNPALDAFVDTHHEAVLRLIRFTAENAHKNGIWTGVCGELAADTGLTRTFLEMGIDELSVSPSYILRVREAVRNTDLSVSRADK